MTVVPLALRMYSSSPHNTVALCVIVYVVNNALRCYCDKITNLFEASMLRMEVIRMCGIWFVALHDHMEAGLLIICKLYEFALLLFIRDDVKLAQLVRAQDC